jgi:hypothetical protein
MPNHYYGYNPDRNTVNSNQDNFQDDVYRPPLGDMSTNPSSPLFQAMNNQRGDTFRQFEANQDGAESYINNLCFVLTLTMMMMMMMMLDLVMKVMN